MRSDYGLYVVAVICFIIAGIFLTGTVSGYAPSDPMGPAAVAIFSILGVILAVAGYTVRPKVSIPAVPTAPQPLQEPSTPPPLPAEEKEEELQAPQPTPTPPEEQTPPTPSEPAPPTPTIEETAPTPPPTIEEPAAPVTVEEKPVRRRRKKKTA